RHVSTSDNPSLARRNRDAQPTRTRDLFVDRGDPQWDQLSYSGLVEILLTRPGLALYQWQVRRGSGGRRSSWRFHPMPWCLHPVKEPEWKARGVDCTVVWLSVSTAMTVRSESQGSPSRRAKIPQASY
ncbi:hypothetical protein NEUTE2DRAFT_50621, partial [Neurospora tetrasperma FGSC 2509]